MNIKIWGRVQGVFFRDSARRKAWKLGITGFVRNEPDGTVYVEAEGNKKVLEQFLEWCRCGPQSAEVEKVESFSGEAKGLSGFVVK